MEQRLELERLGEEVEVQSKLLPQDQGARDALVSSTKVDDELSGENPNVNPEEELNPIYQFLFQACTQSKLVIRWLKTRGVFGLLPKCKSCNLRCKCLVHRCDFAA